MSQPSEDDAAFWEDEQVMPLRLAPNLRMSEADLDALCPDETDSESPEPDGGGVDHAGEPRARVARAVGSVASRAAGQGSGQPIPASAQLTPGQAAAVANLLARVAARDAPKRAREDILIEAPLVHDATAASRARGCARNAADRDRHNGDAARGTAAAAATGDSRKRSRPSGAAAAPPPRVAQGLVMTWPPVVATVIGGATAHLFAASPAPWPPPGALPPPPITAALAPLQPRPRPPPAAAAGATPRLENGAAFHLALGSEVSADSDLARLLDVWACRRRKTWAQITRWTFGPQP
jgi:hypothetical protein